MGRAWLTEDGPARWLVHTSVLDRLGPVPATSLDWPAVGVLLGLTGLAAVGGLLALEHRDLASA